MQFVVHTQEGKDSGRKVTFPPSLLVKEPNEHVLYLEIKRYLAAQRQGTHKTKTRKDITGSTRKLKKQKGTGTARAGSIKSPLFRGGGRVFGPQVHTYHLSINKKTRRLARKIALSDKLDKKALLLVEDFQWKEVKTKRYLTFLKALEIETHRSLLVTEKSEKPLYLSSRNLQHASVTTANQLNAYDILSCKHLILSEKALTSLEKLWT